MKVSDACVVMLLSVCPLLAVVNTSYPTTGAPELDQERRIVEMPVL